MSALLDAHLLNLHFYTPHNIHFYTHHNLHISFLFNLHFYVMVNVLPYMLVIFLLLECHLLQGGGLEVTLAWIRPGLGLLLDPPDEEGRPLAR